MQTEISNTLSYEERRNIPVKFIIHSDGWFMCATNWSKSYSAGVSEFNNEEDAKLAANARTKDMIDIYQFNEFGERIK